MKKKVFVDQMNRKVEVNFPPKRIVSLVPSQTEFLYTLGLESETVGITKFCIHPAKWFKSKQRIGGTKDANVDKIAALKPDLIIGNKEENQKENIEVLERIAPIWMSDIYTLPNAFDMMSKLGEICGKVNKAEACIHTIKENFKAFTPHFFNKTFLYLIWENPTLGVGKQTFINHLLTDVFKMKNSLGEQTRYPEINEDISIEPDFIFLSSEPFPFKEKHIEKYQLLYPNARILLVDGEFFSWYGSRLLGAPSYFMQLQNQF